MTQLVRYDKAKETQLVLYEQARTALAACRNVDEAKHIRDKVEALRAYARQAKDIDMETWAAEIKVRAIRRIGEISMSLDKAKPSSVKGRRGGFVVPPGGTTKKQELAASGLSEQAANRCEQVAAIPEEDFEDYLKTAMAEMRPVSTKEVLALTRKNKKIKELQAKAAAVEKAGAGDWKIVRGDCLEVLNKVPDKSVRLIFADPPYNIGIDYGDGPGGDKKSDGDYLPWCLEWMKACVQKLTDDGSLWVMIGDEYADAFGLLLSDAFGDTTERIGSVTVPVGRSHRRAWIKWYETFGVNCSNNFNRTSRHIFYYVRDPKNFVFNADAVNRRSDREAKYNDKRANPGGKIWDDVWQIPRLTGTCEERVPGFPTQLPLALLRPIVGCASDPGDVVLDPFCGSGTTGLACIERRRRFIGIEKSEKFAKLATQRINGLRPECSSSTPSQAQLFLQRIGQ